MFWFFGHKACASFASQSQIKPVSSALEDKVLTTGRRGSPYLLVFNR